MEKEIKREKRGKEKGEIQEKKKGKGNKSENQNGQEKMDEEEENDASTRWVVILGSQDTLGIKLNLSYKYPFFLEPQNPMPCYGP